MLLTREIVGNKNGNPRLLLSNDDFTLENEKTKLNRVDY